jgi:hypothetical protein
MGMVWRVTTPETAFAFAPSVSPEVDEQPAESARAVHNRDIAAYGNFFMMNIQSTEGL